MKFPIIIVNIVAVVSINGQFLEAEFSVGSVPLNFRSFEIRQSVGQEIQSQADGTASGTGQGRRHIENQRNIRNGPNRNANNFDIGQDQSEFQNNDQVPLNRRLVNHRGQNGNNANRVNAQTQDQNLATALTNNRQGVTRNSGASELSNQDVAVTNQGAYIQQDSPSNDRTYESYPNQPNSQNQQNGNRRQDNNEYISSNIRTSTTRTIIENGQNGGTVELDSKSAQDNELSNKPRSDEKWVWTDEGTTKTMPTIIPTVDDRAAFTGDQCPTGKVKFNNSCVEKD